WTSGDCTKVTEGSSFVHPITFNLYVVGEDGAVGGVIASVTQDVAVPFRPSAHPDCGTGWMNEAGDCNNGYAFNVTFDLGGAEVPSEIIYGIEYNTNTWGYAPMGPSGNYSYESLNVGLVSSPEYPTVGADVDADIL